MLEFQRIRPRISPLRTLRCGPIPTLASSLNCCSSRDFRGWEAQWLTVWLTAKVIAEQSLQNSGAIAPERLNRRNRLEDRLCNKSHETSLPIVSPSQECLLRLRQRDQ